MGAIASGGVRILNQGNRRCRKSLAGGDRCGRCHRAARADPQGAGISRRPRRPPRSGRTVILVDDGLATGSTMPSPPPRRSASNSPSKNRRCRPGDFCDRR